MAPLTDRDRLLLELLRSELASLEHQVERCVRISYAGPAPDRCDDELEAAQEHIWDALTACLDAIARGSEHTA